MFFECFVCVFVFWLCWLSWWQGGKKTLGSYAMDRSTGGDQGYHLPVCLLFGAEEQTEKMPALCEELHARSFDIHDCGCFVIVRERRRTEELKGRSC